MKNTFSIEKDKEALVRKNAKSFGFTITVVSRTKTDVRLSIGNVSDNISISEAFHIGRMVGYDEGVEKTKEIYDVTIKDVMK